MLSNENLVCHLFQCNIVQFSHRLVIYIDRKRSCFDAINRCWSVGVSHESVTNVNEPQAMNRTENIDEKSDYEHDIAEETQFPTPKSNVSLLFSVFYTLA